jgi:hypothetical protein
MNKISILFLGDIALNGVFIDQFKRKFNPFKNLATFFLNKDLIIGNLECMAKGDQGENLKKKPRLTTNTETLSFLNTLNIKIVSLAHNHVYDHLEDGFLKTTQFLNDNKIKFTGASLIKGEEVKSLVKVINDVKFGFLNYVTSDTNPSLTTNAKVYLNIFNLDNAIEQIKQLKQRVNHVILLLHWGGSVEGGLYPDWDQPKIAKKLIDAGADVIIGHHSHTIQPFEIYKGKYIFYSLGNFCFSDFCFEGKNFINPKRRKKIIIPHFSFNKINYSVKMTYWINKGDQITPNPLYKYNMIIKNLLFLTHKLKPIWSFYFFIHRKINPVIFYFTSNDKSIFQKIRKLNWDKIKRQILK